jgi:predicted enzyme related to lactoylglutathione lyase
MVTRVRFVIAVPDLATSSAYYRDVLTFTIHPLSDPGWLVYTLGACTIMAGQCPDALHPSLLGDHSFFAYVELDDVESYYERVQSKGADVSKSLRAEPWGMREFGVRTIDGHRIMFAQPSRGAATA